MAHVVALPAEPRRRHNIQVAPCVASARGERRLGFNVATGLCDGLGAAAAVLCTDAGLRRLGATRRAVELRVCVLSTSLDREPDDLERHIGRVAGLRAFEAASLGPGGIDLAEVNDATAVSEVIQVENLGLAPRGAGGLAALQGHKALGGRTPVNPCGRLESKGHRSARTGWPRSSNWSRTYAVKPGRGRSPVPEWLSPKTAAGYGESRKPFVSCLPLVGNGSYHSFSTQKLTFRIVPRPSRSNWAQTCQRNDCF